MKYGTPQAAMRATITQREGPELDRLGRGVVGWRLCGTFDPRKGRPVRRLPSMFCSSGLPFPSPGHPLRRWSLCGAGCGPGTPLDTAMEATRQLVKVVREQCLVVGYDDAAPAATARRAVQLNRTGRSLSCPDPSCILRRIPVAPPSLFFLDWAGRWNLQRWRAGGGRAEIGLSALTVCWRVAGVAGKVGSQRSQPAVSGCPGCR